MSGFQRDLSATESDAKRRLHHRVADDRKLGHEPGHGSEFNSAARATAELGTGEPLAPSVRARMEGGFGQDLGAVRVHRDTRAAELADAYGAAALTVGQHLVFGANEYAPDTLPGQVLLAHELAHTMQQRDAHEPAMDAAPAMAEDEATRAAFGALLGQPRPVTQHRGLRIQSCKKDERRRAEAAGTEATGERLLGQFAANFAGAAAMIRGNPASMQLLQEAESAGASYGGYSEDGPGARAWPYTAGTTVYVPRAFQADPQRAVSSFLFELTNAISRPRHAEVERRGREGAITAEQYAHDSVAIEVDGKMRMAEIWASRRDSVADEAERARLDRQNFYHEYIDVQAGRRTREDIIREALSRTYPDTGQTVRDFYIEQYNQMHGTRRGSSP